MSAHSLFTGIKTLRAIIAPTGRPSYSEHTAHWDRVKHCSLSNVIMGEEKILCMARITHIHSQILYHCVQYTKFLAMSLIQNFL